MNLLQLSADPVSAVPAQTARRWLLSGVVQGVGFRPFVYRLAVKHGLRGWVRNCAGQVEVVAMGNSDCLREFETEVICKAPTIAHPVIAMSELLETIIVEDFCILPSRDNGNPDIHIPPDYFVCEDCLAELYSGSDRRFRYPFINCAHCGPRYTLIMSIPYDRVQTSMASFAMCSACEHEYLDNSNRRFHAEPVACPRCGPQLTFHRYSEKADRDTQSALHQTVTALRQGQIVAVKGVGGYHLLCDATNRRTIQRLRQAKSRPHKPLAVMFPEQDNLEALHAVVELTADEVTFLRSPQRPILLARKKPTSQLHDLIAPALGEIGVMLPYTPLHHLLLNDFRKPVVATSANISGEPVLTEAVDVERHLRSITDACLHHDRPIIRPADDSVFRIIGNVPRPLRLGRGNSPLELALPCSLERPVLAVGAHTKNTVCLAWDRRAVVSPHIGDMGNVRSMRVFEQLCADLQRLYSVRAEVILCDAHRGYTTAAWAHRQSLETIEVQHHAAHASCLIGESGQFATEHSLVFTWDGVGMGADGTLWGGEGLYGNPGHWQRLATWRSFRLPGGEMVGREPWRSALSVAWELGNEYLAAALVNDAVGDEQAEYVYSVLQEANKKRINSPQTSSVGRLFDAAAAIIKVCPKASFEGHAPMWFEALAVSDTEPLALPLTERPDGIFETDWRPLFDYIQAMAQSQTMCASVFHDTLAQALLDQALAIAANRQVDVVGLSGGVFQNRRLTESCLQRLQAAGFNVVLGQHLPVNDAGLSYGQVVEYAAY